ncbi:hypothetical protein V8C26DRAFT_391079 [Trichoderma gracile]
MIWVNGRLHVVVSLMVVFELGWCLFGLDFFHVVFALRVANTHTYIYTGICDSMAWKSPNNHGRTMCPEEDGLLSASG